jgi:hypothetical protein
MDASFVGIGLAGPTLISVPFKGLILSDPFAMFVNPARQEVFQLAINCDKVDWKYRIRIGWNSLARDADLKGSGWRLRRTRSLYGARDLQQITPVRNMAMYADGRLRGASKPRL